MGWFWADGAALASSSSPPHTRLTSEDSPQPGCPMHKPSTATPSSLLPSKPSVSPSSDNACCDVAQTSKSSSPSSQGSSSYASKLNPLNYMPTLTQERAPKQKLRLPTTREVSTIPRGDNQGTWQYPSPQQMFNAMLRKGYDDTPEDAVESMVAVHNYLNEGAWREIMGWEKRFGRGLFKGILRVYGGEEEAERQIKEEARSGPPWAKGEEPKLVRFMGRPGDVSPKARIWEILGSVWPGKFAGTLPFDRHDWFVERTWPNGSKAEWRYVIDYYEGPDDPTGEPVFYLDVRPAIDGPTAACERVMRWGGDVWCRASGAKARSN